MRLHHTGLVGLFVLAIASLLFVSACIIVPVDDGRRGDRDRHGDGRDRHDDHRRY